MLADLIDCLPEYANSTEPSEIIIEKLLTQFQVPRTTKLEISIEEYLSLKLHQLQQPKRTGVETDTTFNGEIVREQHRARGDYIKGIVAKVVQDQYLNDQNPAIDLYSLNIFRERVDELVHAFSELKITHALAVKANPIRGILREAKLRGLGAECASYPEAKHALSLGFDPRKVVFDTPCKSYSELKEMIQVGCYINLDNLEEIEKVNQIFEELKIDLNDERHHKQIGLRINPVVGGGAIESTSTATATSKFGLPLTSETSEQLFQIFETNRWLQGLHIHVGSQGCALSMLVTGAQRAVAFAQETNNRLGRDQIQVIDIGGGMPTIYDGINEAYTFQEYAAELKQQAPELFSGKYEVISEFGRSVFVKPGITISKVEAVKTWCNQHIAVVHVGANQFLRTAYLPHQWKHSFSVFTAEGTLKDGPFQKQDIAGPMCFSGDYLAKGVYLPLLETGDYLVIHDTGGYTTSMYSKYNSRRASAMYSYLKEKGKYTLSLLKSRETTEETLAFWGE